MATVALVAAVAIGLRPDQPEPVAAPSPPPSTTTTTPSPTPSPPPTSEPTQTETGVAVPAGAPLRVEVPSVGIDVEVLPITPTGPELDPPSLYSAYWIEPYGRPGEGSDNTTYIAGHSATRGTAVFDPLFDQASQTALVSEGDEVVVSTSEGTFTYAVTAAERYPKDQLATTDEVWAAIPDRLVLITCFQRADGGASQDNLVVYAELVEQTPRV